MIPPDALPEGVDEAILAISHDSNYSIPGTEHVAAGNALLVTLQVVPTLEDVGELVTDATVYAPYGDTVSTAADEAAVELAHEIGGTIEIITDEVDSENGLVAGSTTAFSPFLAVLPAPEELSQPGEEGGEGQEDVVVYTYAVTDVSGAVLCQGSVFASAMVATFASKIRAATISDTWVDILLDDTDGASVTAHGGWFPGPVLLDGPAAMTEPGVLWSIDVNYCGSNDYTFDAVAVEGTMSNWAESEALLVSDCGQTEDQACTRHIGTADATISTNAVPDVSSGVFLTLDFNGKIEGSVEADN